MLYHLNNVDWGGLNLHLFPLLQVAKSKSTTSFDHTMKIYYCGLVPGVVDGAKSKRCLYPCVNIGLQLYPTLQLVS